MTFQDAANRQYLHSSIYTVFLIDPDGTREQIGTTHRKSGTGLMNVLRREPVQEKLSAMPIMLGDVRLKKTASALIFTNGYRIEFGGTIRQESN